MLPRAHRLTDSETFRLATRAGVRVGGPLMVVHLLPDHGDGPARVGFVVGKPVGNSVTRSLVSRRLRHAAAAQLARLSAGQVVVVRALPATATAEYGALATELDRCLTRGLARLDQPAARRAAL